MEGDTGISAIGVDEMWLCLGVLGLRSYPINRVDLDSGITNPASLCTSFSQELQTKPKQDLSQKNYTRTAQPARVAGGAYIAPSVDVHLFCSLHYWGVRT